MDSNVTSDLMFEVLKQIREDVAEIRARGRDHDEQFKGLRHLLVAMQSDDLRHEATMAGLRADVDTIRKRLDFPDA